MSTEFLENIRAAISAAVLDTYGPLEMPILQFSKPPKVELGDVAVGVFPLAKALKKAPAAIAAELAGSLRCEDIAKVEATGPYLNITFDRNAYFGKLVGRIRDPRQPYGRSEANRGKKAMVEFSSPNTNKPLHLGHVRNIVLGDSVSRLLEATGWEVIKSCLANDRGVNICKSMLAYAGLFGAHTPESKKMKGDHFVGECYVAFERALKLEKQAMGYLPGGGAGKEMEGPLQIAIRELLRRWEADDPDVRALWQRLNAWVYDGFDATYKRMGVSFDKMYYESELYSKGRSLVLEALEKGIVQRNAQGAVEIPLGEGLDPKVLLRSDGTTLYITQDIGVAVQKYEDYGIDRSIYVVASEQDHQLKALFTVLRKMGYPWAEGLFHLSYGMVYLPEGRMKTREGTVVDADDLMDEMQEKARLKALEALKQDVRRSGDVVDEAEVLERARMVSLGAIKHYMLKVNPRKDFTFDPEESIQLTGDTGPYVQYTHARIRSLIRNGAAFGLRPEMAAEKRAFGALGNAEEREIAAQLMSFPSIVADAAAQLMPSTVARYVTELAAAFNRFYHCHSVLEADSSELVLARLALAEVTAVVLKSGLELLGIEAPEAM